MKYFKILLLSFCVTLALGAVFAYVYIGNLRANEKRVQQMEASKFENRKDIPKEQKPMELKDAKNLTEAIATSDRVNFIAVGTDGERTDTIILFSYDVNYKMIDIMSIPRDTYIEIPGHERADHHKINAVYGMGKRDGGISGLKLQVSELLGIPIHYYVMVDYRGIRNIVDVVGGVEVEIKQRMFYDDPTASPPLHIYFEPGVYNLTGNKVDQYLRWRKNNDGSGGGSDLDRNTRQIDFVKKLIYKSITSLNIINVVDTASKYVETDIAPDDMLYFATTLVGFNLKDNFKTHVLPGKEKMTKLSYYFHDVEATRELMYQIYLSGTQDTQLAETEELHSSEKKQDLKKLN